MPFEEIRQNTGTRLTMSKWASERKVGKQFMNYLNLPQFVFNDWPRPETLTVGLQHFAGPVPTKPTLTRQGKSLGPSIVHSCESFCWKIPNHRREISGCFFLPTNVYLLVFFFCLFVCCFFLARESSFMCVSTNQTICQCCNHFFVLLLKLQNQQKCVSWFFLFL